MSRKIVSGIMLTLLLLGMFTLAFNIQPAKSDWTWTGTVYIRDDGSVDPSDAPITTVDNVTYTLTDNIVGVPAESKAVVVERDNIVVDGAGYIVEGTEVGTGITLSERSNVTIKNTQIKEFTFGIYLDSSFNNSISGNNITDNLYGIWLSESLNNSISGNTIANNISLDILLEYSSNNSIVANNITANNHHGIMLGRSYNNYIVGNSITENNDYGIYLLSSYNNSIVGNSITNNKYGFVLDYSSNNKFYHNNLIDNAQQVHDDAWDWHEFFVSSVNIWDDGYPYGGNYWSDYAGSDIYSGMYQNETGYDWIGDSPYIIYQNNTDRYPLMYPFVPEMEEIRIAYRNLLLKYTEIKSDFEALNSTYYELLDAHNQMVYQLGNLNFTYYQLLNSHNELETKFNTLNATYQQHLLDFLELQGNYASLNSSYNNLQSSYNQLSSSYSNLQSSYDQLNASFNSLRKSQEAIASELNTIRNLMYVFIATMVILIVATVYLAMKKPKTMLRTETNRKS